jgi:ABC-type amino acid transport substrate-binding protein
MDLNSAYWQGSEPKNSEELRDQINRALLALKQWKSAANIPSAEDSVMIDAQVFWLEELLKLANIELKSE